LTRGEVSERLSLFAVTAPGLESLTGRELEQLGLPPSDTEPGGVAFQGSLIDVARANLWLRTATRVLVRLGSFHSRALGELERKSAELPWRDWLAPGVPLAVRVTCRKSRLFHQRAVAERILAASGAPGATVAGAAPDDEECPGQLVVVRVFRDECTVSLDSSGALLHRRGYRLQTGKAPLRETLAAGLLIASGWQPDEPLIDPFCGSGTIPIEAALLARRLAPGGRRDFAFQRWPRWDAALWRGLLQQANEIALARAPAPIIGADRDAGAIAAARANADRAGVAEDVEFHHAALSALAPPAGPGHLVTNPPYGVRVGEAGALRDLYARLGQVARQRLAGWRLALLLPAAPLERATGLGFRPFLHTRNGGLAVRGVAATVDAVGAKE
jgi:putative N6-adenine-specific DNA methylase